MKACVLHGRLYYALSVGCLMLKPSSLLLLPAETPRGRRCIGWPCRPGSSTSAGTRPPPTSAPLRYPLTHTSNICTARVPPHTHLQHLHRSGTRSHTSNICTAQVPPHTPPTSAPSGTHTPPTSQHLHQSGTPSHTSSRANPRLNYRRLSVCRGSMQCKQGSFTDKANQSKLIFLLLAVCQPHLLVASDKSICLMSRCKCKDFVVARYGDIETKKKLRCSKWLLSLFRLAGAAGQHGRHVRGVPRAPGPQAHRREDPRGHADPG